MDQKPSIARVVHYVLPETAPGQGEHRPAVITRVMTDYAGQQVSGVNLSVSPDAADMRHGGCTFDRTPSNVQYAEAGAPGTWHWPERV